MFFDIGTSVLDTLSRQPSQPHHMTWVCNQTPFQMKSGHRGITGLAQGHLDRKSKVSDGRAWAGDHPPLLDWVSNIYGGHAGQERGIGHNFCLSGAFGKEGGLGWEWASLVRVVQIENSPVRRFRWRWTRHWCTGEGSLQSCFRYHRSGEVAWLCLRWMRNISCIGAIQRHTLALPSTTFQSSWAEGSPGPLASRMGAYWSVAQERKSFTARKVILATESWVGFWCGHLILEMCWESCPIGYKQQVCWQRLSQGWEPAISPSSPREEHIPDHITWSRCWSSDISRFHDVYIPPSYLLVT